MELQYKPLHIFANNCLAIIIYLKEKKQQPSGHKINIVTFEKSAIKDILGCCFIYFRPLKIQQQIKYKQKHYILFIQ